MTKANRDESNTKYAQGGIAVVSDFVKDEFEKHVADTLDAGDGLCDEDIVDIVIKEGRERVDELIEWGARFDKDKTGNYKLGKEGGHSENRVLHHKDITGWEIERTLLEQVNNTPNITIEAHHFVIDLITQHHLGRNVTRVTPDITCYGVYVLDLQTKQIEKIISKITILGTGGFGQAYRQTTNPTIATGDGIAMVYRAKGRLANMEFVQFHPTSLYDPGVSPSFLITEAVRGDGGILRTKDGKEFMHKYDERGSLAPRDIVARAIDNEMKISGDDHVYLDCRHMDNEAFKAHFPNITKVCESKGIDVFDGMIPVVPAAHYACGGIQVDEYGRTSIKNLYACGECTCTGLHGANRLASNSLLEAIVFSQPHFQGYSGSCQSHRIQQRDPGLDRRRNHRPPGDGTDHSEHEGAERHHEQLCGHRAQQPPTQTRQRQARPLVPRNRSPIHEHDIKPATLRTEESDHHRIPDHAKCHHAPGEPRPPLYHRLSR